MQPSKPEHSKLNQTKSKDPGMNGGYTTSLNSRVNRHLSISPDKSSIERACMEGATLWLESAQPIIDMNTDVGNVFSVKIIWTSGLIGVAQAKHDNWRTLIPLKVKGTNKPLTTGSKHPVRLIQTKPLHPSSWLPCLPPKSPETPLAICCDAYPRWHPCDHWVCFLGVVTG